MISSSVIGPVSASSISESKPDPGDRCAVDDLSLSFKEIPLRVDFRLLAFELSVRLGTLDNRETFFFGGGWRSSRSISSSSSVSRSSWPRFFAVGFVVRPAFVVVVGTTAGTVGGGLAGRGVRAGKGVRAGAFSLAGVDGWLLVESLSLILGLPSVGVAGTAGGGMIAASGAARLIESRRGAVASEEAGKYEVGEIEAGSSTGGLGVEAPSREAEKVGGPLDDTDGVLLILSLRVFLALSIMFAARAISNAFFWRRCARHKQYCTYVVASSGVWSLRRTLAIS